jgi:tetratricopeptide (TPR) repeat protein
MIHPSADAPFDISWSQGPSTDAAYYLAPAIDFARGADFKPISSSWNAPAYSLLYLPTLFIFGVGLAQVNLTTVVISLVGFLFFFLILREIKDDKTLWMACLFWAFTYIWAMFNRIPIIYTAMVLYMLIAVWLWIKGTRQPIYFAGAWTVLLIAVLFIKIIAAALIPAFLVGHLIIYFSRRKPLKSTATTGIMILIFAGVVILLFTLIARFFDLSPIDVAAGRIRTHMRADLFDDNILLYIFNFGASGSVIEKNPVISFLSYCYFIFIAKDLFQKRIRLTDRKNLVMVLFVVWLAFGAAATVFFRYAPPRFFLFLYPPMFVLAAAALSRFLDPAPRQNLGYGFYLLLPFWLIFLVFRLLLLALLYTAENYETFIGGLGLSLPTAKNILSILNFASSFYFLLSISLIVSIIITAITFLVDRRIEQGKQKLSVRRNLRIAVVGVIAFVFLAGQATMFWTWFAKPRHTVLEASRNIDVMVGDNAIISGSYAHPLTVENNLKHVYMTFTDPNRTPPCERFAKGEITHLAIDAVNGLAYLEENYPETYDCLVLVDTFYIRGNPVDLYRFTGAADYTPTDYERAVLLMRSENWRAADELFSRVIERFPDSAPAYVSRARCLIKLGDLPGAEAALTAALAKDPDNLMAHWGLGQILEKNGDYEGALAHYREASDLFPANKSIRKRLAELKDREK